MDFTKLKELYTAFGPVLDAAAEAEAERVAKAEELAAAVEADRLATEAAETAAGTMTTALEAFVAASRTEDEAE